MKTVKIELTTWLCYSDETDFLEVELEDEVADKLLAVADGKELNEDAIEELVPEAFEPLDLEAYQRAFDRQVIDGWECCTEDACSKNLREIYEDSYFEGDYFKWIKAQKKKIAQMDIPEQADFLQEKFGVECEIVEKCYEFKYIPSV